MPALVAIREMVDVKHPHDRLAIMAIERAEKSLAEGGSAQWAMVGVRIARETLTNLGREDAATACDMAVQELAR